MDVDLPQRSLDELSRLLDQEQDRVTLALDACGAGTWDWDMINGQLYWGAGMLRLYGITHFGNRYEDFERCLEPADVVTVRRAVDYAVEHHSVFDCKFRLTSRPGVIIRGRGKCYYRDGKPYRMVGVNVEELPSLPTYCPIAQVGCPAHRAAIPVIPAIPAAADSPFFCPSDAHEGDTCPFHGTEFPHGVEHVLCGGVADHCQRQGSLAQVGSGNTPVD